VSHAGSTASTQSRHIWGYPWGYAGSDLGVCKVLTDTAIRKIKLDQRPQKLSDSGGLFLYVTPAGGRLWRLKYRFQKKEKLLSIGTYPAVSLKEARAKRDAAKDLLKQGRDPSAERKLEAAAAALDAASTFEMVTRAWYETTKSTWTDTHAADVLNSLERDVFPLIGHLPIKAISAPLMLRTLRAIEQREAIETARRIRQRCSAVFVYAIAAGIGETDPAAIVKGAMAPLPPKGRQPALTDLDEARGMLRRVEAEPAHPVTKLALRLLALTVVRPGELRGARWPEFGKDLWTVPPERLKLRKELKHDLARAHLVPLSHQAQATIELVPVGRTGRQRT